MAERTNSIFDFGLDLINQVVSGRVLKRLRVFLPTPIKIMTALKKAYEKNGASTGMGDIANDLFDKSKLLGQLISAYYKNEYREIESLKIARIIASLLYFVSPLDLIPDAIPFIGFFDDIIIMTWLVKALNEELEKFEIWQKDEIIVEYGQM